MTDAGGLVGTTDVAVRVDTRAPGALITPEPGEVLAGRPTFEFTPTSNFGGIAEVNLTLAGRNFGIFNSSPDGVWRTTRLMGDLPAGPTTLEWGTSWVDEYGSYHYYHGTPIEVAVDPIAIPLEAVIEPAQGPAPLAVTLRLTASDPQDQALNLRIDWNDGTEKHTSTIATPYDEQVIEHEFPDPGVYEVFLSVSNGVGGYAAATLPVVVEGAPNQAPILDLSVAPVSGSAPLSVAAVMSASDPDEDSLTYQIDFGDGSELVTGPYPPVEPVAHTFASPGNYMVRAVVSDGRLSAVRTARISVVLPEPITASAGDDQTVVVGEQVRFDGAASRPTELLTAFEWAFGDGHTGSGRTVHHTYTEPGEYTVKLTTRAGSESATDTALIRVTPVPVEPGLTINVTAAGAAVSGAELTVIQSDGTRLTAVTGSDGAGVLKGLPDGETTVYVWAEGFQPKATQATLQGGSGSVAVALTSGEFAATTLEANRLTYDEIIERGIDVDDPSNSNVYEADIDLHFVPLSAEEGDPAPTLPVTTPIRILVVNDSVCIEQPDAPCDTSGNVTLGGYRFYPAVQYVERQPFIHWLVVPMRASWLKEFFDVRLVVQNLTEGFTFTEGQASIQLPNGLSLAPTTVPQSLQVAVRDIPGGESQNVTWTIRGDLEGTYDLSADFVGVVDPIGRSVRLSAATQERLNVLGGTALPMTVWADSTGRQLTPYEIWVELNNVSDVPAYNVSVELNDLESVEGGAEYVLGCGVDPVQTVAEIPAGGNFVAKFTVIPGFGSLEDPLVSLVEQMSFIRRTSGNANAEGTIKAKDPAIDLSDSETSAANIEKLRVNQTVLSTPEEDYAHYTFLDPDGDPSRYTLYLRDRLSGGTWREHETIGKNVGTVGFNAFDVPSADRSLGRYACIQTTFADGSTALRHEMGFGPARYVSLGDSYSAGEGVPAFEWGTAVDVEDVPAGIETPYSNDCHRSLAAYSRLIAQDPSLREELQPAVHQACSGAVTRDFEVADPGKAGQAPQLDAVNKFTDVVTLTIGGNDAGFADIAMACLIFDCTNELGAHEVVGSNEWLDLYADMWDVKSRIDEIALAIAVCDNPVDLPAKLICAYQSKKAIKAAEELSDTERLANPRYIYDGTIRSRVERILTSVVLKAPNAQVVVLGYPQLVDTDFSADACVVSEWESWAFGLTGDERQAVRKLVDDLNRAIAGAVKDVEGLVGPGHVTFVDVTDQFRGHELCTGAEMNRAGGFNALVNPFIGVHGIGQVQYSLHPNPFGQELYAEALRNLEQMTQSATLMPGEHVSMGTIDVQGKSGWIFGQVSLPRGLSAQGSATRSLFAQLTEPNSAVEIELVSPSGQSITGKTSGVFYESSENTARIGVQDPEPGTWTVRAMANDVNPLGERAEARAWTTVSHDLLEPPQVEAALVDDSGTQFEFTADITGIPAETTVTWQFSDGMAAEGPTVRHDFGEAPKPWGVTAWVITSDGKTASTVVTVAHAEAGDHDQPPVVTGTVDSEANAAGWHKKPVTVSWTALDKIDGTLDPPATVTVGEGADQMVTSAPVCDASGNCAVGTFGPVSVDLTPPTVVASVSGSANAADWHNKPVTVAFECSDELSGVASCSESVLVEDGADQSVTGEAVDVAGNTATTVVEGLNVDTVAPTLTGVPTSEPNEAGWYADDVTISWSCIDDLAGIPEGACPKEMVLIGEGDLVSAVGSVSDAAGNSTQAFSAPVRIDRTAPVTSATVPSGWSGSAVTVELAAEDGLSGVVSTWWSLDGAEPVEGSTVIVSGDGRHTLEFFSTDAAGNIEEPVSIEILVDAVAPTVTHTMSPLANETGWHREPVTVSFECADEDSGVASCPAPITITEEGAGQLLAVQAVDTAGNARIHEALVNLDRTDPTIKALIGSVPNEEGWYNTAVPVSFECTDELSGVAECPQPILLTPKSPGPVTAKVTDLAGNTAQVTVGPLDIDNTAPQVLITGVTHGARYEIGAVPVPACQAEDAGSGLAGQCKVTVTGGNDNGVGDYTVKASATDLAGNTTTATLTYRVVYRWSGFNGLLSDENRGRLSDFRAGSTVQVKFSLTDARGNPVRPTTAPIWIEPVQGTPTTLPFEADYTAGGGTSRDKFSPVGKSWRYAWKTKRNQSGYYWRIGVILDDGETHYAWIVLR